MLAAYAAPAFAFALPTIPAYVMLPNFYAETVGLDLAAIAAALFLARLLDVVTDPIVGVLSDRWHTRFGRRKPWIAAGSIVAAVALVALFRPPDGAGAVYLAVCSILLYLGWTMLAVPYAAWGAELSDDYHQRSRITAGREAAQIVGILAALTVPPVVMALGGNETVSLAAVAWLAIIAGVPTVVVLLRRVPERPSVAERYAHPLGWKAAAKVLVANRPFVRLVSAWFINGIANGIPASLFLFYLDYALAVDEGTRNILFLAYFVAGVIAIPAWVRLSRRYGKHRTWCGAMILACASFIWVPLLNPGDAILFFVICVLTGMAFGADLALPPAMQADVVDLDRLRTGQDRTGVFFALWSMANKLALAAAVAIAFPLLEAFGFRTDHVNDVTAVAALAMIYALLPTVLKLIAITLVWRHPITERRQRAIAQRLARRDGMARPGERRETANQSSDAHHVSGM